MTLIRCAWAGSDPLMCKYHDEEWGKPVHDDRLLFEMLCLEGAQAGLSWSTILKKREHYRRVFDGFDANLMAAYDQDKVTALLADPGIVRNRLKVNGFIENAKAYLRVREEWGSFNAYIWRFVEGAPIVNHYASMKELPATSQESDAMSKSLKKDGFKFVGSTICYAYMQAVGMVDDHLEDCFLRHR